MIVFDVVVSENSLITDPVLRIKTDDNTKTEPTFVKDRLKALGFELLEIFQYDKEYTEILDSQSDLIF